MTPEAFARMLDLIVPEDFYQSPQVPTRRLGGALISVFGPRRGETRETEQPYMWVAQDPRTRDVLAFARTATLSPYGGFEVGPAPNFRGTLDPDAAYQALRENWDVLSEGFFTDTAVSRDIADTVADAYSSTVPPRYLTWLKGCCADFFDWLGATR